MTEPWHPAESVERQQAARIKQVLNQQVERLRAQKNLTREGRAARIAQAVVKAKDQLRELGETEAQRVLTRQNQLAKKLFGHHKPDPTQVISIRDAQDRVSKIEKSEDMAALMNRADRNGDHVLLKVAAQECAARSGNPLADQGWNALFHTWIGQQHYGPETTAELRDIDTELTNPTHRMLREQTFNVSTLPEEIRGKSYTQINELAAQADNIPELPPSQAEQVGDKLATWVRGHTEVE